MRDRRTQTVVTLNVTAVDLTAVDLRRGVIGCILPKRFRTRRWRGKERMPAGVGSDSTSEFYEMTLRFCKS